MLRLDPRPKVITFDCYGTLVRWHRAVEDASRAILRGHVAADEVDGGVAGLAGRLRERAMARQGRAPFLGYKEVLRSSLGEALAEVGLAGSTGDGDTLLSFLRSIAPHPEVPAALERLRAGYRLGIISNTDDDLIAGTVAAIGVPFDFVVTAEQAGAYKPDHRLFLHAHAVMGVTREETIHVGMGQFTDLKVCHELGIRSVWIDRAGETPAADWPADAVLRDLSGLPGLLPAS